MYDSVKAKKWRDSHKELVASYRKKYKTSHMDRVREWRRKYNKKRRLGLRFQIFERDGFACSYCGRRPPETTLHVDHIFPKSKGGMDSISNYVTSCAECNFGKGDKILSEFGEK